MMFSYYRQQSFENGSGGENHGYMQLFGAVSWKIAVL